MRFQNVVTIKVLTIPYHYVTFEAIFNRTFKEKKINQNTTENQIYNFFLFIFSIVCLRTSVLIDYK